MGVNLFVCLCDCAARVYAAPRSSPPRRTGVIQNSEARGDYVSIEAETPLSAMVGFSTELRSMTEGKGEFSLEYTRHAPVARERQEQLTADYEKRIAAGTETRRASS